MYYYFDENTGIIFQPTFVYVYNLKHNTFHIFNDTCKDYFLLFDGTHCESDIINEILETYDASPDEVKNDLKSLLIFLENFNYITLSKNSLNAKIPLELEDKSNVTKLVNAEIEITNKCNLKCSYCYAETNKQKPERSIDFWIDKLNSLHEVGLRSITFSGGEPFCKDGFLSLLENIHRKFIITINTNALLLNKNILKKLEGLKIKSIQISLDSIDPEYHDFMRGKGTCEKVLKKISMLKNYDIPLRISSTITKKNESQIPKLKYFCEKNNFEFSPETMKSCGFASILDEKYFSNLKDIELNLEHIFSIDTFDTPCQASVGFAAIGCNGIIKPCNLSDSYFTKIVPEIFLSHQTNLYSNTSTFKVVQDACNHEKTHGRCDTFNKNYIYENCVIERYITFKEDVPDAN